MTSCDRRIVALIDTWLDVSLLLTELDDLFYVFSFVVGQAESLESSRLVDFVDAGKRLVQRNRVVGSMNVEDVNLFVPYKR